jgi:AcrR family transcriptional regulator
MPRATRRGRPRSFDTDRALEKAIDVFWTRGFAASSLDDLCDAMDIARPSLYAAYGDKEQLYIAATERFRARMVALYVDAIKTTATGRDTILAFLASAIELYTSGVGRGCLAVCTATVEAPTHPHMRTTLAAIIQELDEAFAGTLRRARDRGELAGDTDVSALAQLLSATLHSIAIRARAGARASDLQQLAKNSVAAVFASAPRPAKRKRS